LASGGDKGSEKSEELDLKLCDFDYSSLSTRGTDLFCLFMISEDGRIAYDFHNNSVAEEALRHYLRHFHRNYYARYIDRDGVKGLSEHEFVEEEYPILLEQMKRGFMQQLLFFTIWSIYSTKQYL